MTEVHRQAAYQPQRGPTRARLHARLEGFQQRLEARVQPLQLVRRQLPQQQLLPTSQQW